MTRWIRASAPYASWTRSTSLFDALNTTRSRQVRGYAALPDAVTLPRQVVAGSMSLRSGAIIAWEQNNGLPGGDCGMAWDERNRALIEHATTSSPALPGFSGGTAVIGSGLPLAPTSSQRPLPLPPSARAEDAGGPPALPGPSQSHAWRCARPRARRPERATGTHAHTSPPSARAPGMTA